MLVGHVSPAYIRQGSPACVSGLSNIQSGTLSPQYIRYSGPGKRKLDHQPANGRVCVQAR